MMGNVFDRVENIVGKWENAGYHPFPFSHNVFKNLLSKSCWKSGLLSKGFICLANEWFRSDSAKNWDLHLQLDSMVRRKSSPKTSVTVQYRVFYYYYYYYYYHYYYCYYYYHYYLNNTISLFWMLLTSVLTISQTSPSFYVSVVQVFWKHCGKRRNCS